MFLSLIFKVIKEKEGCKDNDFWDNIEKGIARVLLDIGLLNKDI